ncbi:hypothetical protein [Kangiella shandongensis]|uniref:hypothetical protein n=1 Tax=Kangiella shandongensis TaxID=2763258 RepID=UPI001CBF9863|nr:hypothetical protein [Kangiella shandongensis]
MKQTLLILIYLLVTCVAIGIHVFSAPFGQWAGTFSEPPAILFSLLVTLVLSLLLKKSLPSRKIPFKLRYALPLGLLGILGVTYFNPPYQRQYSAPHDVLSATQKYIAEHRTAYTKIHFKKRKKQWFDSLKSHCWEAMLTGLKVDMDILYVIKSTKGEIQVLNSNEKHCGRLNQPFP